VLLRSPKSKESTGRKYALLEAPTYAGLAESPRPVQRLARLLDGNRAKMRRLLREVLDLQPGEWLLDVCCGTGDYAAIANSEYVGLDLNPNFIAFARRRYAGRNGKTFIVADATKDNFTPKNFDRALFINALHHFPDDLALRILRQVARLTKSRVVIVDLMPDPGHPLRRILVPLDRGD
jgi:ubiquinone/menaquinone biosynthesis C-methylase UbiE